MEDDIGLGPLPSRTPLLVSHRISHSTFLLAILGISVGMSILRFFAGHRIAGMPAFKESRLAPEVTPNKG